MTVTQRYTAWGGVRPGPDNELPTDRTFTGQRVDGRLDLMYYGARWYDPLIGRFIQADTIVPDPANPQSPNRYSLPHPQPAASVVARASAARMMS